MNTEEFSPRFSTIAPVHTLIRNNSWENFKDPEPLTKLVYSFLVLWLLSLATIPMSRLSIEDGQSGEFFTLADVISYPCFFIFVLSYFLWLTRVTKNALLLAPTQRATLSPIRHLLYYIIPVWNIYGPYDGMKTVYEVSQNTSTGEKKASLLLVRFWWILVLNAVIFPFFMPHTKSIYLTMLLLPQYNENNTTFTMLSLVALFVLLAGFFTFLVIRKVTLYQKDIMDELKNRAQD